MALDLNNAKTLEAFRRQGEAAAKFDLYESAGRIIFYLSENISGKAVERPESQIEYQNILMRAKFIALPTLDNAEIAELLKGNFTSIFKMSGYDLWDKFKIKLISIPRFEDRDDFKKKIREALSSNEETLTSEDIVSEETRSKGTVKNWLTDYNSAVGTGRAETIKLSQYLTSGESAKKLSEASRQKLDYLLKFYEKLKISSMDLEGVEETEIFNVDGEIDIYEEGRTERIGRDVKNMVKQLSTLEEAVDIQAELEIKYRGDEEKNKKVAAEAAKISKSTGKDFKKLSELLFSAVNPGLGKAANAVKAEAILKVLAEEGKVGDLPKEEKFNEMMVEYFRAEGRTSDLQGFKVNPDAPQYVSLFLQYILKDKVGMSEDDSGRLGVQIFNVLAKAKGGEKYQGLAYFDMEAREFRWA